MVSLNSIDPDRVPTFKLVVHGVQIIFVFVIFCLGINIFVDGDSTITGQNGWTFGAVGATLQNPSSQERQNLNSARHEVLTYAFRALVLPNHPRLGIPSHDP